MPTILLPLVCAFYFYELSAAPVACPNNWVAHDSSCYLFSYGLLSWTESYTMCKILGGMLAEVNSEIEKSFLDNHVKQLNRGRFWIGGHDSEEEQRFMWATSRDSVTFTNYQPQQPDNAHGQENCLQLLASGEWNDDNCNTQFLYICEQVHSDTSGSLLG